MIQPSVTISLVPEAQGGPFVFWGDLERHCAVAASLGFAAVELFLPSASTVSPETLATILRRNQLRLAAVGTGAGWVLRRLHLVHPQASVRQSARDFIAEFIDFAAAFRAPAIIGSMQGRCEEGEKRDVVVGWLQEGLSVLGERAGRYGVPLLYEPLNRYETNLFNRLGDACAMLDTLGNPAVKVLADLFHMNIEEQSIPEALRRAGQRIGHVHFVDSNRRPAGRGHLDWPPIVQALAKIDYAGFVSAEALPYPSSEDAARETIETFRRHFSHTPCKPEN